MAELLLISCLLVVRSDRSRVVLLAVACVGGLLAVVLAW